MATTAEFLREQARDWPAVTRELRNGVKTSHWIWWVFPQLDSLGRSQRARHFGLSDLDAARDYLAHPVLRARLIEAAGLLLAHTDKDPQDILGPVDAAKVRSCMTLFSAVPGAPAIFRQVLDRMYGGAPCPETHAAIGKPPPRN